MPLFTAKCDDSVRIVGNPENNAVVGVKSRYRKLRTLHQRLCKIETCVNPCSQQ